MQILAALAMFSVAILPAHAAVVDSTVSNGDTLTEAPESFSVTMNEDILQVAGVETANVLYIQDAEGNYYGDGCVTVDGTTASIEPALGEAGEYTFSYTVVSSDTHAVSDTFNFTWEPEADFAAAEAQAEAPTCGAAEESTEATEEATEAEPTDDAATEDAAEEDATEDATASDSETTGEEDAGLPGWAFAVISIALLALIVGVIIGNWVKARRQIEDNRANDDGAPEDDR
ncbi:copper resistance CopC family protein [Agrococcus casei]|uniref:copper resistance CopC family protein n=1 Tax=Agrococcus casei TaxID=343512 RepID=UPI003F909029